MERKTKPTIVQVAREAILEARRPLSSKEILEYARKRYSGFFTGRTPRRSIQAAVWKSIHLKGARTFKMVGPGRLRRRYWLQELPVPSNWSVQAKGRKSGKK
jgi:hypothetical protein